MIRSWFGRVWRRRSRNAAAWDTLSHASVEYQDNIRWLGKVGAAAVFTQRLHDLLVYETPEDAFLREALRAVVNTGSHATARAMALDLATERLKQLRENDWRDCDVL